MTKATIKAILIGLFIVGALSTVAAVGQERKPLTGGIAATSLFLNGIAAYLITLL